jgi:S1-C subfamily serine protease
MAALSFVGIKFTLSMVALASLTLATPVSAALPPNQLYAKLAPSVWRVYAHDAQGKEFSQGSGIVIDNDTIITNCHVIARGKFYSIRQENRSFNARLTYADPLRDMCQLDVRNFAAPSVVIGDSDKVGVGERIYALGNPRGMELTLSDGLVSALRKDDAQRLHLIQITAPISPGSSGGGLFDEDGKLIGITTLQRIDGQNLNLAIPVNWLRDLPARSAAGGMNRFLNDNKAAEAKIAADAKAATIAKIVAEVTAANEAKAAANEKAAAEAKMAAEAQAAAEARKATEAKAAAESLASAKAAAEKAAAEKVATERLIAERVAAEKEAIEREAARKIASAKEAIERESAARMAAERAALEQLAADRMAKERATMAEVAARNKAPGVARKLETSTININDVEKFKLVASGPGPEENYRKFLTYALPRAFAVAESGNTWGTYGVAPRDPSAPKDPAARAIMECEKAFQRKCQLYAVDNTVVFQKNNHSN